MPVLLVVIFASLYADFAEVPEVRAALAASAAAAAGLVIGTAIKMTIRLRLTPTAIAFGGAAFLLSGLLNVSLLLTIGVLVPLSLVVKLWSRQ